MATLYIDPSPTVIVHPFYDYYLKFNSEAEAKAFLFPNASNHPTESLGFSPFGSVDMIGTIINSSGVAVDGYHVNVRSLTEQPTLDAYKVTPINPKRMWL